MPRWLRESGSDRRPLVNHAPQRQLRLDRLLDLVEGETEFTPSTGGLILERVPPGGNITSDSDEFLREESDKQFSIKPCAGTPFVMLGKVAQLRDGFQAPEDEFNLPAQAVRL